jgi:cellulose biosynthesis protein BcsQ
VNTDNAPIPAKRDGKIITFYSYKGGTGRTMALANAAWVLASAGKRVLMIDWDLEAPGLHRYFTKFLRDPELSDSPGLIDFFQSFFETAYTYGSETSQRHDWHEPFQDLSRLAIPVGADESFNRNFPGGGSLDLLAAGTQGAGYGKRVSEFQWTLFYEKLGGGILLELIKSNLRNKYDFILIDSRTGLSDTAGICTVQMPDELVVCFTYNIQSIDGAAAAATSASQARRKNDQSCTLKIWPMPTRVDDSEMERLNGMRDRAREKFAGLLWHVPKSQRFEALANFEVRYEPFYAYEERLAAVDARESGNALSQPGSMISSMCRLVSEFSTLPLDKVRDSLRRRAVLKDTHPVISSDLVSFMRHRFSRRMRVFLVQAESESSSRAMATVMRWITSLDVVEVLSEKDTASGMSYPLDIAPRLLDSDIVLGILAPGLTEESRLFLATKMASAMGKHVLILSNEELSNSWNNILESYSNLSILPILDKVVRSDFSKVSNLDGSNFVQKMLSTFLYKLASTDKDPNDPHKGAWGKKSARNGFELGLKRLNTSVGATAWLDFELSVTRVGESMLEHAPESEVIYFLHPTFHPSTVSARFVHGRASIKLSAWGAFTIGALVYPEMTTLELDLAELEQLPQEFRYR